MQFTLGIDIGSTTVKIAILNEKHQILFSDYKRHFANIRETLSDLLQRACEKLGNISLHPVITGSGGLTLANHLQIPFVQEVIAVRSEEHTSELQFPPLFRNSLRLRTWRSSWAEKMRKSSILKAVTWSSG